MLISRISIFEYKSAELTEALPKEISVWEHLLAWTIFLKLVYKYGEYRCLITDAEERFFVPNIEYIIPGLGFLLFPYFFSGYNFVGNFMQFNNRTLWAIFELVFGVGIIYSLPKIQSYLFLKRGSPEHEAKLGSSQVKSARQGLLGDSYDKFLTACKHTSGTIVR